METDLLAALSRIEDPQLSLALSDVAMLGAVDSTRGSVHVELRVPVAGWPGTDVVVAAIEREVRGAGGADPQVTVRAMTETEARAVRDVLRERMTRPSGQGHSHDEDTPTFLERGTATRVLGISSGKGGVGKSSVTVNLAISLARLGHSVGVLDADVYGFSVPKMVAAADEPVILGDTVVPTLAHGVKWLSMGWFVSDDQPVIWRGPLLHKAITQFVTEAWWGQPDYLVIDMPPGTGDVALTLSQVVPSVEVYVVTTPQPAAQRVAQRSALAARKLRLAVRGVIENMTYFMGEDGTRYELFGAGGGAALSEELGVPLLGQLELLPAIREGGDTGVPVTVGEPEGRAARGFAELAERVATQGPARVYRQELRLA